MGQIKNENVTCDRSDHDHRSLEEARECARPLTAQDVEDALADPRHNGYGFAERSILSATTQVRLTRIVAEIANDLGWDREMLFQWTDSKYGRWLADSFRGPRLDKAAARETVRKYVNAEAARLLAEGR